MRRLEGVRVAVGEKLHVPKSVQMPLPCRAMHRKHDLRRPRRPKRPPGAWRGGTARVDLPPLTAPPPKTRPALPPPGRRKRPQVAWRGVTARVELRLVTAPDPKPGQHFREIRIGPVPIPHRKDERVAGVRLDPLLLEIMEQRPAQHDYMPAAH